MITGYAIAIWTVRVSANINSSVYALPRRMPDCLLIYPTFPFVRALYLLIDACTFDACYGHYSQIPPEFREMQFYLLLNFAVYLTLAIYLQLVLPQDYGVPKHLFVLLVQHHQTNQSETA